MKRLTCLLIILCLLLAACGSKSAEAPTEAPAAATEAPTTEATEAPTAEATEAPATEATEPETQPTAPPEFANPLTGEPREDYYTGRPVAFTLNNISVCLPQYGLDKVDWLFEAETEGGITRCLGIMTDPSQAGPIGPIRSGRTYFLNLSVSYHAPLFHCGGSPYLNNNQYSSSSSVTSWDHINQMVHSNYFYREPSRAGKYAFEHTLFTSGDRMVKAMADLGYDVTSGEPVWYGYQFDENVQLDGQNADKVSITFRGSKNTLMEYDAETGLYNAHEYGKDWVEGSTGKNATFRNVLVILTTHTKAADGCSFYDLDGTGDGYFAVNGKMIPIQWHHKDADGPFQFTTADGNPITLGIGKTYCAIVSTEGSVKAE